MDDGGNSHAVQVEPELLVEEGLALGPAALEQRLGVDGSADWKSKRREKDEVA